MRNRKSKVEESKGKQRTATSPLRGKWSLGDKVADVTTALTPLCSRTDRIYPSTSAKHGAGQAELAELTEGLIRVYPRSSSKSARGDFDDGKVFPLSVLLCVHFLFL
jgi:hypothetical protein